MTVSVDELPFQLHQILPRQRRYARDQLDPYDESANEASPCERA